MAKFEQLESAVVSLDEQVKKLMTDLQSLITVVNSNSKSQSDLAAKTKTVTKATEQISAVEKELESIRKRGLKVTKETVSAKEALRKRTKELTDAAKKENGTLKKSGGLFRSMTKSIIAAGAAMFGLRATFNVIKAGVKTIIAFEKGMSEVKAITGATDEEFKALESNALLLGKTTSKTASEVAQLEKEFAKLGFTTPEILAATEATIRLSIAAGSDLAESAVVAASTIRGFNLSATETQRVVDVMAKSFSSSALDLEKFKIAMSKVAPVARASGKTLEFATAQLGILSDAGLEASIAGTSLRNMFLELNKQGLTWEEALENINNSTNKNVTALNLFGKRGATAALILAENIDKADELKISLDEAAWSAKDMAFIMEDNLAGDIKKAQSAWEGFILGLNDGTGALSNAGRKIVKFGTNALKSLNTLDLWFKRENKFTSDDFDRLLDNMSYVETESGKTIEEIIKNFEKLNKGLSTEDLLKRGAEFKNLFKEEGETVKSSLGLWGAYVRDRESQIQIEKDAILAAEQAVIDAAEEAARVKAEIEKEEAAKLAKEQLKIDQEVYDEKAKAFQDFKNKREAEELAADIELSQFQKEKLISDLEEQNNIELEAYKKNIEEKQKLEQEWQDVKKEIKIAAIESAGQIISDRLTAGIDNDLASFQAGQDAEKKILDDKLDKGAISEKEYAKKIAALEKKGRIESAKAEKKKAVYDATIAAAVSVIKQLAATPLPLGLPFIAGAAAIGALQIGVAASTPIPKFEHGTDGQLQLATDAIVSEGGQELLKRPGMPDVLTPINKSMIHLPKGSEVIPNYAPETQAALSGGMSEEYYKGLIDSNNRIEKAINRIKQPIQWTGTALRIRDEESNTDKNFITSMRH